MKKNYRKKGRRLLSMILSLTMLLSMVVFPEISFAVADTSSEYSNNRADISFEYMGVTSGSPSKVLSLPSDSINDFTWTPNSYIWVGVYVEHMDRLSDMFTSGLDSLVLSMLYDSNYLTWSTAFPTDAMYFLDGNDDTTATYPYTISRGKANPHYSSNGKDGGALSTYEALQEWDTFYPKTITNTDNTQVYVAQQSISFSATDTTAQKMFIGDYLKEDKTLVALFPLQMKDVEAPTAGTKILEGTFDASTFVIGIGDESYNFRNDHESSVDLNLNNRFNIVSNVVNLFPATYTVTYDANASNFEGAGYNTGADNVEKIPEGDSPTLKNANGDVISTLLTPPNNKVFEGWYTSATDRSEATKFDTSSTVSENTTVYANYIDGHKVTFHLNGTGAQFNDETTADKTFTAASGTPLFGASDTFATKLGGNPTRAGYTFKGWYTRNDSNAFVKKYQEADLQNEETDSIDLYARWEPTSAGKYTLNFDKNTTSSGATDSDPTSVTFNSGESLDDVIGGLPIEPTRTDNYKFMGWYLNKSGDGTKLESDKDLETYTGVNSSNQTATVYARWDYLDNPDAAPNPLPYSDTVTVKFDKTDGTYNGGTYQYGTVTNGTIADKYVKLGEKIEYLPGADEMKQDGMAFDGWYTAATGGTKVTTDTPIDTSVGASAGGTITLYARWIDKVTLSYDLNGLPTGSFTAPASVTDFPGTSFTVATFATVTDYNFIKWNTSPDGTGTSYTPGDSNQKLPSSNTKLYAIWNYTGPNAVSIVFNGNGTATNPATVTPNDGSDTTKYVITRAQGSTVTAAQMPSATREKYTFNHWGTTATEAALTDGATQDSLTVSAPADGSKTINMYAIWKVTNPADARTVTFDPNASNPDASPSTSTTVTVALGDTVSALPTYTRTGYSLSGWMESPKYSEYNKNDAFTTATVVTDNITVKAYWTQNVTVTYDKNGGTLTSPAGSDDSVTLQAGQKLTDVSKTTPTVEKTNYTFKGWYYEDTNGNLVQFTDATVVSSDLTVHASWEAKIKVEFNNADDTTGEIKYTYDGNPKTPLVEGNYKVSLLDGDTVADDITSQFQLADFSATYTASADGSTAVSTAPTDADVYTIALTRNTANASSTLDKYTTYTITAYPNTFEIEGATINYIVSGNYQYLNNTSGITDIGIAIDGTPAVTPNINIAEVLDNNATTPRTADINVKFTNKKDAAKVFTNTMPNEFGEYKIEITATDGSNFKVGTVKDSANVTPAVLYLMNMSRVINVNYGDGVVRANGVDTTDHVKSNYATVSIPTPNPITSVANAKTTLASQSTPIALPVEGTDFTPPQGKTLEKFETRVYAEDGITVTSREDFTAATDILSDPDDLTIYAVYKDAQWTVTFHDTKTNPAAEADKKYTVAAGKSILGPDEDGSASVKKIEQYNSATTSYDEITSTVTDKTVLPKPTSAPANMQFGGWTIDSTVAAKTDLTSADITGSGTYANKMFTNANYPGDSLITEAMGTDITVYAVYVKSSDATLSEAVFKEVTETKNPDGSITYTTTDTEIVYVTDDTYKTNTTFDSDNTTQYLIASNGAAKTYVEVETTQPGSTVVISDGKEVTVTTTTATIPLTVAENKSSNEITVTVTSPDGTKKIYTFYVLRKAIPGIQFDYGNSPAGLIMRDDTTFPTEEEKEAAITAFDESDSINKTYGKTQVPVGGEANMIYTAEAWRSYTDESKNVINYDLDPYALFAYQGGTFKVPGYKVIDELGNEIDDANATESLVIKKQLQSGASDYSKDNGVVDYSPSLVKDTTDTYDLTGILVRMDVYFMNYSYNYTRLDGTQEPLTAKRPVIILSRRGDIYLEDIVTVNEGDVDYMKAYTPQINAGNSLVAYRCMDFKIEDIPTINEGDVDYFKQYTPQINASTEQYYKNID